MSKKWLVLVAVISVVIMVWAGPALAGQGNGKAKGGNGNGNGGSNGAGQSSECACITQGEVEYSASHYFAGQPIPVGFDEYGYNYQSHLFNGSYANVYLGGDGFPPYLGDDEAYLAANPGAESHWAWPHRDINLLMKWNEAWISNKDCDADGSLDRHYGFDTYIGSGAWETNHMRGGTGSESWTYFTKIMAAPADASLIDGIWYNVAGIEIGPVIWGEFITLMEVESGLGATYVSPAGPGFGKY